MSKFSSMVDMAKDTEEVRDEVAPSVSVYPYGLCLAFDDDIMEKLGITEMPDVGDMIHIAAMAKVTSVSDRENECTDGTTKRCRRVELQITHLATENEDDENDEGEARRSRFYDKTDVAA